MPEEVRPDWWIVCEVAKRLGFEKAFSFSSAAEIFAEHAALSAFENNGSRDFDLSGYIHSKNQYDRMQPFQWPLHQGEEPQARLFSEGGFFTPDRRAQFHLLEEPALKDAPDDIYPLLLNTGRVRDQWHTMTRTGLSRRLSHHLPEPFAALHPDDAAQYQILDGGFIRLTSRSGTALLRARVSEGQRKGEVFAPIHWTAETSSHGRIGALVQPATDCYSGQPELKATAINIAPVHFAYEGFVLSRETMALDSDIWFSRVTMDGAQGTLLATDLNVEKIHAQMQDVLDDCTLAEFHDEARDEHRLAFFKDGRIEACLFLAPAGRELSWNGLKAYFANHKLSGLERLAVLSGQGAAGLTDSGPIVCACYGVSLNSIQELIEKEKITSTEEIGRALKAGTNCGSCLPELRRMVKASH
jgi:assimilatory nitrate reductase catalytic subunit